MDEGIKLRELTPAILTAGRLRIQELSPHRNRGLEISYICKGHMEWLVDGVMEEVQQGMVFFTLPWQAHGSANPCEPPNEVCHLLLRISGEIGRPNLGIGFDPVLGLVREEEQHVISSLLTASRHAWPATQTLAWLIQELTNRHYDRNLLDLGTVHALTKALLLELCRIVSGLAEGQEAEQGAEARVRLWFRHLADHCEEEWSVNAMAEACELGRSRFNSLARQVTGCSPMQYLKRLRLRKACYLLQHSAASITGIAFDCGFTSSQQFAKEFKKGIGLTPRAYRRQNTDADGRPLVDWSKVDWRDLDTEYSRVEQFRR